MNINHAKTEEIYGDKLQAIFTRQKSLMGKYHDIELKSGLLQTEDCPVNLDDKRGQARIKDFSWRVTEELGEALDARSNKDHYQEELIDGLHFLTELTVLAGKDYDSILPQGTPLYDSDHLEDLVENAKEVISRRASQGENGYSLEYWVSKFIENLGMMCNCLKNKPWKQSMMKTDREAFYSRLSEVWVIYITILVVSGMNAQDIADIYLKKSQVNQFRQRSNY
jgi:dimeric dUTPase (all-alpha-NTP-PPase superfamily)|nr:MAG TPA: dUTPase [Caudoviricetes sp.]